MRQACCQPVLQSSTMLPRKLSWDLPRPLHGTHAVCSLCVELSLAGESSEYILVGQQYSQHICCCRKCQETVEITMGRLLTAMHTRHHCMHCSKSSCKPQQASWVAGERFLFCSVAGESGCLCLCSNCICCSDLTVPQPCHIASCTHGCAHPQAQTHTSCLLKNVQAFAD